MENKSFEILKHLIGYTCIYEHGVTTFTDCVISGTTSYIQIRKEGKLIQSITPTNFFVLIISEHAVKVVFVA